MDELLQEIALRLRHSAAVDVLETLANSDERMNLLANVIAPPPALERASLQAAQQVLDQRLQRSAAA